MSPELIILCLILAAVLYLIFKFHAALSKLVPGKAGDFLDDFKLNNSNAPVLTGDHVVQVTQAVGQAVAQSVQAVTQNPTVTVPGSDFKLDAGMARILGVNQQTSDVLNSRVGQTGDQATLDPNTVYYYHHTMVNGPTAKITTEPLQGPTKLQLTYTSQEPGKTGPTQAWASVNGGPEQGPMQCGVSAEFPLGDSGTPSIAVRFDTNGRMIGQLMKG